MRETTLATPGYESKPGTRGLIGCEGGEGLLVKVSDDEVVAIREAYRAGTTQVVLAARYGISQEAVSGLVVGRTRQKAGGPITSGRRRKLTDADVAEIRRLASEGLSFGALATRFGVSPPTITTAVRGHARPNA